MLARNSRQLSLRRRLVENSICAAASVQTTSRFASAIVEEFNVRPGHNRVSGIVFCANGDWPSASEAWLMHARRYKSTKTSSDCSLRHYCPLMAAVLPTWLAGLAMG